MGLNLDLFMDNKIIKRSLMYKNVKLTFVFKTTFCCTVHTFISMDIWYTVIQHIAIFDTEVRLGLKSQYTIIITY